ncbi:MAG: hypothetical protein ACFFAS_15280 [Promethearchaeota archaeon]
MSAEDKNYWMFFVISVITLNTINVISGFLPHYQGKEGYSLGISFNALFIVFNTIHCLISISLIFSSSKINGLKFNKFLKISLVFSVLGFVFCILILSSYLIELVLWHFLSMGGPPNPPLLEHIGFPIGLVTMLVLSVIEAIWCKYFFKLNRKRQMVSFKSIQKFSVYYALLFLPVFILFFFIDIPSGFLLPIYINIFYICILILFFYSLSRKKKAQGEF